MIIAFHYNRSRSSTAITRGLHSPEVPMAARKKAHEAPPPFASRASKRMLPSDAVFWYAEELSPGLRSTIGGLMIIEAPPDWEKFRDQTAEAVRLTPRLREKI